MILDATAWTTGQHLEGAWLAPSELDMVIKNSSKRQAYTLRCGNIKATIWRNVSEKGPFFAATFSRPFKDQSGAWHNGTSFGL